MENYWEEWAKAVNSIFSGFVLPVMGIVACGCICFYWAPPLYDGIQGLTHSPVLAVTAGIAWFGVWASAMLAFIVLFVKQHFPD
jgi:hypothetical protein